MYIEYFFHVQSKLKSRGRYIRVYIRTTFNTTSLSHTSVVILGIVFTWYNSIDKYMYELGPFNLWLDGFKQPHKLFESWKIAKGQELPPSLAIIAVTCFQVVTSWPSVVSMLANVYDVCSAWNSSIGHRVGLCCVVDFIELGIETLYDKVVLWAHVEMRL